MSDLVATDMGDENIQVDSTPTEENIVETPENEEISTQEPQEEGEAGDKKKNPPFNEHPRWKEMMAKLKNLEQENKQLKATTQPKAETAETELTDQDKEVEELFKDLPEVKFQNEYKTYGDFYKDIRRSIIKDLVSISQKQAEKTKAEEQTKYEEFRTRYTEIKAELGDEASDFERFVREVASENPESNLTIDQLYTMYLKEFRTVSKSVNPSKVASSKIAKTQKPSGSSGKKPSYEYISNRSMSDMVAELGV